MVEPHRRSDTAGNRSTSNLLRRRLLRIRDRLVRLAVRQLAILSFVQLDEHVEHAVRVLMSCAIATPSPKPL